MENIDYKHKLINYIKKNLKKGYTPNALKFALIKQGYSRIAVEEALKISHAELAERAPALKEKPIIRYEIIDENNRPVQFKQSFLKRIFRFRKL